MAAISAATAGAGTFEISSWAYDRGNVRTFLDQWADAAPMVAFGGSSPVFVEYDVAFPTEGNAELKVTYASADARPVQVIVNSKLIGEVCIESTGSWVTSQAQEGPALSIPVVEGVNRIRFERKENFPHLVSLRFNSTVIPEGYTPARPRARQLPTAQPPLPVQEANPEALRRAISDLIETFGTRYPNGAHHLARLAVLTSELKDPAKSGTAKAQLLALQREALLENPLLDFDRILLLQRGFPAPARARGAMGDELGVGSLNAHTSDTIAREGRWNDKWVILSNLRAQPRWDVLYEPPARQTLIDPVLDFDGTRMLFAKRGQQQKNWRIWEMGTNGKDLRQVTPDDGEDVGHFDPCYLPDERIIFASTAVYQGLPCEFGGREMVCLYQLNRDTQAIRQLTFDQDSDWCPTILPNGRVLYQRWEYTDQSHSNSRMLFHMNPDGTDQREFRGSGSWFPGSFFYAKPIPGESHRVIGVAGGHHGTPRSGRLLILDPTEGRHDAEGIVQEIPGWSRKVEPIVRDRLVDGVWPQFLMPFPLNSKYHLVAAKLSPNSLWGIYLVDIFDNLTLIQEIEGNALLWPIPLQKRPRPPAISDRVDLTRSDATLFISDIYSGPGLAGIPRGTVKRLRIIEYYFSHRGYGGLYGTLGADGPWDVKRILGTVPVEADGSVFARIPANSPLSLQPLDAKGQALQIMRSWLVGMPGEAVSCAGCHENQDTASANRPTLAAGRTPAPIEPWFGPPRGFAFVREVQPVLDRYCVSCHDGKNPGLVSFKPGEMLKDWTSQLSGRWDGGGRFAKAYFELQRFVRRPGIEGDRRMFTPMEFHFSTTVLGQILGNGHYGVTLDAESWSRLAAWADLNAPCFGAWGEIPQFASGTAGAANLQRVHQRAEELRHKYVPMGPFPNFEEPPPPILYDTTPVQPGQPKEPGKPPVLSCAEWPFDAQTAVRKQIEAASGGKTNLIIPLGEGIQLELVRVPAGSFIMGSEIPEEHSPKRIVQVKAFWLAKMETSNAQFRQFCPEHESRTEDRHGYQFGVVGYDEDQPDQPVVRVSWGEAAAFCRWISRRSRLHISLPTEAQWEWACRAGTATPFWFGEANADYSRCANMADRTLQQFAADTSLDDYSAARPMNNPNRYDDWIPRDDRIDDGGFVTEPVGKYRPNPWGLHDMHGNAWEWTRSAYSENQPGDPMLTPRVVRGGSWYDRPNRCTSSYRLAYAPWQRVFNVGFRVVCEDSPESQAGVSM